MANDSETSEGAATRSILQRVASGEHHATRECIDTYGGLVWSIARRLTRTPEDAEDAVQDIFFELWRHAVRYTPAKGSEQVFIATLARRRLIDRLRKRAREPITEPFDEEHSSGRNDGRAGELCVEASRAAQVISTLEPEHRKVLIMSIVDGMSHAEISHKTRLPLGTVKSHIRRSLIDIRIKLTMVGS